MTDMANEALRKKTDEPVDNQPPVDDKQCRICLCEDDDPSSPLDRLFRPCRCNGTMAYVHGRCLDQWRRQSVKQSSMYRCDQCGYEYQMSRLGSPAALAVVRLVKTAWFCQLATVWLLLFVLYIVGLASRLYWGREAAPDVLYTIMWDMCDGAIFVGPLSFVFSIFFWIFQYGGVGLRGIGTGYGRLTPNDKDCGKLFFVIIVLVGLAFAFRFLYGQIQSFVRYAASNTARHVLDIRDVQPTIDLGDQPQKEWVRQVYTALAAAVLFSIVASTGLVVGTLVIVLWTRL